MSMGSHALERHAQALDQAQRKGIPIAQPAGEDRLDLARAYQVQARLTALRCARGESVVGLKLAFTNRKTMVRVGVTDPVSCSLCSGMQIARGGVIGLAGHLRLRAEPEVAFLLRSALPPDATWEQALAAIEGVATAIEIVDSRYRDFQFHLPDMVADSASACAFVLGDWRALRADLDLRQLAVALEVDGQTVAAGSTAAILDHPVHALQAAARLAAAHNQPLGAGSILMAGSATDPFVLQPGQRVLARIEQLGTVEFSVDPD